ncbi:hypothetical protein O159_13800 [Leifsonia xyli subsp. cynodontis DSM 46306]|uniref:DUF1684 domain-containing protein n=1 Tax=Leifsonia xyli subsp. cynodontis DSM 46306 TaxID=1389489 RepID=U3P7M0_LEIXC|nr:DUF1684 domain-containing protein [Leifsonia xyli]AGW41449.1 hypothetical protein O159_13800 [Leifsonia xyli subsp. cynodontis DSM 46306]
MTDTAPPSDPRDILARYRQRREQAVVAPKGSLALVNTQWITGEPGSDQTIWGVPGRWAPLPAGQSGLRVTAAAADGITVDGTHVDGSAIVRGKDDPKPSEVVFSDTVTGFVIASETGEYALRVWDANSEAIRDFGSIDAFPFNPEWIVQAAFRPIEGGKIVGFEHLKDDGATRDIVIPGEIAFTKDGVDYSLAAFQAGRALQLVFADSTNGDSTYAVGRFLFVAPNSDGTVTLDFNLAVLPPCAFSYNFNCPLPPAQNRFAVPIEAGEKNVLDKAGELLHR